ncbi:amidase [Sphingomonas sp. YR710]|uniref:amidase n=1 Tax=Sphingomonas sp. YR710 TaxID=1882773 RepID=UPI00210C76D0|nr:amidase [Sphingomonas sp. YR710]
MMVFAFPARARSTRYPIAERSIVALQADLASHRTNSRELVEAYLARIAQLDKHGPRINALIAINPHALADADARDAERRSGGAHGPLYGIPILLKDNIESRDPMPTTAGSLALAANMTLRDAPLVARLRAAGAIILGKTNLSEWANFRSTRSTSGWSAVGGFTRNPYALDRSACGSSAGSGAATAASLAAAAIGTETDGSITCPSAMNGLVGLKPTVGLVSRTHVVPISHSQDTPGPMARNVRDAAILLYAIAGSDPADPATIDADRHRTDYVTALDLQALSGKRIGVMRFAAGFNPEVDGLFAEALEQMRAAGATIVEISTFDSRLAKSAEGTVLAHEFRADLNVYLATTPSAVKTRTLAELIAFNRAHADSELRWFGQDQFEKAEATGGTADDAYTGALATAKAAAGPNGIDLMLAHDRLDALVAPTTGPAWKIDLIDGDHFGGGGAGGLAAIAGYPHLTVPMGLVKGLPVGLSFIGPAWSEARLLAFGFAYEQRTHKRRPPAYRKAIGPA